MTTIERSYLGAPSGQFSGSHYAPSGGSFLGGAPYSGPSLYSASPRFREYPGTRIAAFGGSSVLPTVPATYSSGITNIIPATSGYSSSAYRGSFNDSYGLTYGDSYGAGYSSPAIRGASTYLPASPARYTSPTRYGSPAQFTSPTRYGASSYGTAGYGAGANYGTATYGPSYGATSYGAGNYGTSSYASTGFGATSYSPSGFGASSYGARGISTGGYETSYGTSTYAPGGSGSSYFRPMGPSFVDDYAGSSVLRI